MKVKGNRMICSLSELASFIAGKVDLEKPKESVIPIISFAVCDEPGTEDFDEIELNVTGWYGIHRVETGFDSDDLHLIADYYGGGAPMLAHIYNGLSRSNVKASILIAMSCSMQRNGDPGNDPQVFVIIDRPDSKTEIHVEVFEGLVQNVYCSDPNVDVNVIDRDVQDEVESDRMDDEIESVLKKLNEHKLFNVW